MTFGPLALLRRAAQTDDLEVVAVNDLMGVTMLASLLPPRRHLPAGSAPATWPPDTCVPVPGGSSSPLPAGRFVKVFGWYDTAWID